MEAPASDDTSHIRRKADGLKIVECKRAFISQKIEAL